MNQLIVFWEKEPVGRILNAQPDNFHLCGKWQPIEGDHLNSFINEIQKTEDSSVCVGTKEKGVTGVVCAIPDDYIDILIKDSYRNLDEL